MAYIFKRTLKVSFGNLARTDEKELYYENVRVVVRGRGKDGIERFETLFLWNPYHLAFLQRI